MTGLTLGLRDTVGRTAVGSDRATIYRWAGLVALVPTVVQLAFTIGTNTPLGLRLPLQAIGAPIEAAAVAGPAVAALVLGYTATNDLVRVAMLTAGVFGGLTLVSRTATGPAIVSLGTAGVLLAVSQRPRTAETGALLRFGVTIAFVVGIVTSLSASLGFEPAITRRLGSVSIAVAIAGTPAYAGISLRSLAVGAIAGVLVFGFGLLSPVLTAAVSLLGLGIVGLPLVLFALGAVGGMTAVASGAERRAVPVVLAGLLVLAAGVPTTVPVAVAVLVAIVLFAASESGQGVTE
ncbi:MAG: hypothetical protein U5K70_06860 [Halodesulfurarchaeum sp.]|nr:hypothetical protein [Halodesulfurarchaeum sp.]